MAYSIVTLYRAAHLLPDPHQPSTADSRYLFPFRAESETPEKEAGPRPHGSSASRLSAMSCLLPVSPVHPLLATYLVGLHPWPLVLRLLVARALVLLGVS